MGQSCRYVRLSLAEFGALSLECVVIWGLNNAGQVVNLALAGSASQRSTHNDDTAQYGPQRAKNIIITGYDISFTQEMPKSWWQLDLGQVRALNTVLVSNFCSAPQAYQAESLRIELSDDGNTWRLLHDQNNPGQLETKFERILGDLKRAVAQLSLRSSR